MRDALFMLFLTHNTSGLAKLPVEDYSNLNVCYGVLTIGKFLMGSLHLLYEMAFPYFLSYMLKGYFVTQQ